MKPYAIVKIGSSQYKVSVGDSVVVDRINKEVGEKFKLAEVLMTSDGSKVEVGTPFLKNQIEVEVVDHHKGKKVKIHKFKAKSRYKLTNGFRAFLTTLKVVKIEGLKEVEVKEEKKAEPKKEEKKVAQKAEKKETVKKPAAKKPAAKTTAKKK